MLLSESRQSVELWNRPVEGRNWSRLVSRIFRKVREALEQVFASLREALEQSFPQTSLHAAPEEQVKKLATCAASCSSVPRKRKQT